MADAIWYSGKGGEQKGPFTEEDVKAKLASGEIAATDLLWKEGMDQWKQAAEIEELADAVKAAPKMPPPQPKGVGSAAGLCKTLLGGGAPGEEISTPVVSLIDKVLVQLRFLGKCPDAFRRYQSCLTQIGCLALLAAGAVLLIQSIVESIRAESFTVFLIGLAGVLGAVVLHYVAAKFGNAGQQILAGESHRMSSRALMDCVGLIAALGAIAAFINGIVGGIQLGSFGPLLPGLVGFVLLGHLAVYCLNPKECLSIEQVPQSAGAGETALAILVFVYRCVLAIVPVLLGVGAAAGAVWMLISMFTMWAGSAAGYAAFASALSLVVVAGLAPLVVYVAYLLAILGVDLCMAIFRIARNTERR